MYACEYCGKSVGYGNLVSHAKNRTKTARKPNLHYVRVMENGQEIRRRLCTTCLHKATRPDKNIQPVSNKKVEVAAQA
jgi:ribosomal protein L28